ncbi:sensor histidine kinase [Terribacillus saccharophilus]|uniref:sensor histidine kinase n=1 Tax=Terribacillus saccharophilus TaxID=361277 RepID=UPI003981E819
MMYVAAFLALCLLISLFLHYRAKKKMGSDLEYMAKKLKSITVSGSSERLLLMTEDQRLRDLLNEINGLLDYHQEKMADLARLRIATNRMLSNVSHDLKTPLTVISGYIETIQHDDQFSDEEREMLLAKVQVKVMEVAGLINTFFDLAKLEAEDWQLDMERIQLNELCRKVVLGFYDTLTSKGFAVHIELPDESIHIEADPAALTRVLENLISNSIRYGRDGKTVGMTLYQDEEAVYIDIWDKGQGIQEMDKGKIFERLYTADDSRNSSTHGSGLGLMIAKRLTEQMQGQISFASVPYTKTTFTLAFPKPKLEDYSKLKKVVRNP